ncbi:restriction endonuclease subunit S [Vibrio metschnikovii]|nr:restriction endonuclease subunit S [Vibrio metschnikovii]
MASSWITCKISDVAEVVGGGTPSTKNAAYYGGDISWITPKDLSGYTEQYICKGERNITPLGLEKSSAKLLPKGTILFSSRAPIGYVAIAENPLSTNQGFKSIVPKDGKLDSLFGYYLMKYYASEIERHASGSTFKEVSGSVVKNFDIKLPSCISMQKSIASILSSVDEKIANNTAMNQTLEKIAQRIFKSWFIDFDPVKANKEGVAFDGLSPQIQALFPSEFEDSELGMIPKGWNVDKISKLSNVAIGKTPPRKQPQWFEVSPNENNTKWISIKDMGSNGMYSLRSSECLTNEAIDKFNVKLIPENTVLLSFKLTLGRLSITTEECATNEAIAHFKLDDKHNKLSTGFIYFYLKNFNFNLLGSTSSIATAINSKMVKDIPVLYSNDAVMFQFTKTVEPLIAKIKLNAMQIDKLERIRDRLLPKLISGQITVGEAQKELAEAI